MDGLGDGAEAEDADSDAIWHGGRCSCGAIGRSICGRCRSHGSAATSLDQARGWRCRRLAGHGARSLRSWRRDGRVMPKAPRSAAKPAARTPPPSPDVASSPCPAKAPEGPRSQASRAQRPHRPPRSPRPSPRQRPAAKSVAKPRRTTPRAKPAAKPRSQARRAPGQAGSRRHGRRLRRRLVAARRRLPGLSALVRGRQRRRRRRPARPDRQARLSQRRDRAVARHRRDLAVADPPVARLRRRLRRRRLRRDRPGLRDPRRLRSARGRGASPGHPDHARPGDEPHQLGPSLVRGVAARPVRPVRRLVSVARRRARPVRARREAEQLDVVLRRVGVDVGRGPRPVLHAHVPARAARRELAQPGRPRGDADDGPRLARARGRRLPARRLQRVLQGRAAALQPAPLPRSAPVRSPGPPLRQGPARAGRLPRGVPGPRRFVPGADDRRASCSRATRRWRPS